MDQLTTEDYVRDAVATIDHLADLLERMQEKVETRLFDDDRVSNDTFDAVEDAHWAARNKVDDLAAVLRRTLATVSR